MPCKTKSTGFANRIGGYPQIFTCFIGEERPRIGLPSGLIEVFAGLETCILGGLGDTYAARATVDANSVKNSSWEEREASELSFSAIIFARDKNVISVADNRFGEIENDKGLLSMRKSKSG
ncbi:MAG: hypothetical protein MUC53_06675 [Candidatus Contendobacter sp.]|jgi:hypothetical protein|nr:hypothetical protein [Candidatus Contendobacter sp.]